MSDTIAPVRPARLIINGEAVDAASGRTFTTTNPPPGSRSRRWPRPARRTWIARSGRACRVRGPVVAHEAVRPPAVLTKLGDLVLQNADELARLETLDNGKPIFESRQVDIPMVSGCFHYFAGWATKLTGETIPVTRRSSTSCASRWGGGRDHPVELPDDHGGLEGAPASPPATRS